MLHVYQPGDTIVLPGNNSGLIQQVSITGPELAVMYKVSYWVDDERKETWVSPIEIGSWNEGAERIPIGFITRRKHGKSQEHP